MPCSLKSAGQILRIFIKMEPEETPEFNQASGNSIFWALVALALNAMTEPSRIGSFLRPRNGPGTATNYNPGFDPLRSSPALCAAETLLDIFFFIFEPNPQSTPSRADATPNTPNTTEHRLVGGGQNPDQVPDPAVETTPHPERNTVNTVSSGPTLKIVAFFLGVLPQAIKLFSMKGIVGTQICASMFLVASVVRAISCKSSSHFSASIKILGNFEVYPGPRLFLFLFTITAHYIIYIWIYFNIAAGLLNSTAEAATSDRSVNLLFEFTTYAKSLYMLFGLLTICFNLGWRRSSPLSKWFPLMVSVLLPSQNTSTRHTESGAWIGPPPFWLRNLSDAIFLIALSLIGCLQVSALCLAGGQAVSRLTAKRAERSGRYSDGRLPTASTNVNEPVSTGRFHVIQTMKQGVAWLKVVLGGLCKAIDNHGEWLGTWHEGFGMSTEQFVLACGIFNLLTALLYYLVVFDSTGTSSPLWTSALG